MMNNKNLYLYLKKLKPILSGVVAIPIPGEKNSFTSEEIFIVCEKLRLICYKKSLITNANN